MSLTHPQMRNIFRDEEALIRPTLASKKGGDYVMGSASRALHSKLNRGVPHFQKSARTTITNRQGWSRGNVFDLNKGFSQRVVIKAHVVKHIGRAANANTMRSHAYYLAREGAGVDGEKPSFYSSDNDDVHANDFIKRSANDPHHFRIIISPENGYDIEDFNQYVRDWMEKVEKDISRDLDWVAVNHFNTDNPHAHVIIRGRDLHGKELKISRDTISHGMRERAQEVATAYLGERSLSDIREQKKSEVTANRVVSFDYRIDEIAGQDRIIDVRIGNTIGQGLFDDSMMRGRLKYLRSMGLAEEIEIGVFKVKEDFKDTLYQVSRRDDIIKSMYDRIGKESARMVYVDLRKAEGKTYSGVILDKGPVDELKDRYYVVIRNKEGQAHYLNIGANRSYEELSVGGMASVSLAQASTGKADFNIADIAGDNNGVYCWNKHLKHVQSKMSYLSEAEQRDYVDRHFYRLESLEKSDVVQRINNHQYKVPDDLIERGQKITEEINEKLKRFGVADVDVFVRAPLEKQVTADAWTELDERLLAHQNGKHPGRTNFRELNSALDQRRTYLLQNGYAKRLESGEIHISSATKPHLLDKELNRAGAKFADKFGREYMPIKEVEKLHGVFRGKHSLYSGDYAVVTCGGKLSLVKMDKYTSFKGGQEITVSLNKQGQYLLKSRTMSLGRGL